jgi:hypothetical protein
LRTVRKSTDPQAAQRLMSDSLPLTVASISAGFGRHPGPAAFQCRRHDDAVLRGLQAWALQWRATS